MIYEESKVTMVTKEFQFKSLPTQNDQNINDLSQNNIDLLKNNDSQDDENPRSLQPIAKILNLTTREVSKIQWFMMDQYLMLVLDDSEYAIFDGLLCTYPLFQRSFGAVQQTLRLSNVNKISPNVKADKKFELKQAIGNEIYIMSNKNTQIKILKISNQTPQQVFVSHL